MRFAHQEPGSDEQIAEFLYFDEKDNRTEETADYAPKGFTEETVTT